MSLTVTSETPKMPSAFSQPTSSSSSDEPVTATSSQVNMVIRQDPFYITLDASALLAVSILTVLGMHFVHRALLEATIISVPIMLLIHNDYLNFLKLGPGGTPPTPSGYARLTFYRLFTIRDPLQAPERDPSQLPSAASSGGLPYRPGPRPSVAGLAPQRQLNQAGPLPIYNALRSSLESLAHRYPNRFVTATSCLEKHGFALFSRHPVNVCGNGEICHIHTHSDRSMHTNLHPDDIKEVLEKGWGERHPMAWSTRGHRRGGVPETFTMVYAPRDENDLRIVCKIIEAAIWYTACEKVEIMPESVKASN
ncbi:hypothetical protein NEUTE1DRAFT_71898 [Neurospora tetrasperma FGSC 2508]|uniref:Luciferase domain-containing protein n=1 Tax=Neurospora tetrasperma (strain FGSC 2508 / ATCC MYA-4615 / P0657) TaxID=510951 RepID=F8N1V6_NEUT8|nr:uncharacterized protein NEUTE1DRAFT_71898 [Neurospora tetrasperma FGSC 2508]EGO52383.1 hypothetical protein NEUTE1DRAFT_71898 [Neurospora tetrasperma FGSC 2508]